MALFRRKQTQQQGPQIDMQAFQAIKDKFNQQAVPKKEIMKLDHERQVMPGVTAQMGHKARMTAYKGNQLADQARATVRPNAPQYAPTTDDVLADIDSVAGYGGQVSPYAVPMAAASPYIQENAANQPKSPWEGAFWDDLMNRGVSPIPDPLTTQMYEPYTEFDYRESMQGVPPMDMAYLDQMLPQQVSPIPDPLDTQMYEPYTEMTRQESMEGVPPMDTQRLDQLLNARARPMAEGSSFRPARQSSVQGPMRNVALPTPQQEAQMISQQAYDQMNPWYMMGR